MTPEQIIQMQRDLTAMSYYDGLADGIWGPKSIAAWAALVAANVKPLPTPVVGKMAWGAKVSAVFRERIQWVADQLAMPASGASWLMACIAWESAESFRSDIRNAAGSGAVGLIQFMPSTAALLGTSVDALSKLKPEDQIVWLYRYFEPYKGKLNSLGDAYMAILWPVAVGKPNSYVLWERDKKPTTYRQNIGLDINKDGAITRFECVAKVQDKLDRGMTPANLG